MKLRRKTETGEMVETGRRKYDLYLMDAADARLIAHLEKFPRRRVNEELRRMLYLALDGVPGPGRIMVVDRSPATGAPVVTSTRSESERQDDPPADIKTQAQVKAKSFFGMPG